MDEIIDIMIFLKSYFDLNFGNRKIKVKLTKHKIEFFFVCNFQPQA